jgi:hypothetical protein
MDNSHGACMKNVVFAIALLATIPAAVVPTNAVAQTSSDRYRFNEAQRRYDRETAIYEAARDQFVARGGRLEGWNGSDQYRRDDRNYDRNGNDRRNTDGRNGEKGARRA